MSGRVRWGNRTITGEVDGSVEVYRSIRYAEPLEGEARYRPPVPADPGSGPLDAREPGPSARQVEGFGVFGSTLSTPVTAGPDCLTLTVRRPVPAGPSEGGRPVVVWVHGGGNISGSADLPVFGRHLAASGCVVVAVNYRLGIDANLRLAEGVNRGLDDLAMALRWVAEHIEAFGGDPAEVTLAGHSSGATNALAVWLMVRRSQARGGGPDRLRIRRLFLSSGSYLDLLPPSTSAAIAERFWSLTGAADRSPPGLVALGEVVGAVESQMIVESILVAEPSAYREVATRPPWQPSLGSPDLPAADLATALADPVIAAQPVDIVLSLTACESAFFTSAAPDLVAAKFGATFDHLAPERAGDLADRYLGFAGDGGPVGAVGLVQTHNLFTRPTLAVAAALVAHPGATVRIAEWQPQSAGVGAAAHHGDDLRGSLFGSTPAATPAEIGFRDHLARFASGGLLDGWAPIGGDPLVGPIRHWVDDGAVDEAEPWAVYREAWQAWPVGGGFCRAA